MAQDEFLEDDLDDQKTVEYIKNTLPQELKDKYTDDILYYMLDVINDYFTTSGVLDQEPDADGCIDIDNDALVAYIIKEAKKDKIGTFPADEVILIVEPKPITWIPWGNNLSYRVIVLEPSLFSVMVTFLASSGRSASTSSGHSMKQRAPL